jgi:PAS domain S-box-containing protein
MQIAWHLTTRVCLWTKCAPITSGSACFIQKTLKDFVKRGRKVSLARFRSKTRGNDGKYRWFLIRYNPFIDEKGNVTRWYATGTDIEYRKQAEDELRQDEHELRQFIDFLPQHVVILDKDGTLLQANKTLLDYMGFTLEEMKGAGTRGRISRDVHPEDLDRFEKERSAGLSKGRPFEMEKRLLGKDGRYRWFLVRCNPVAIIYLPHQRR